MQIPFRGINYQCTLVDQSGLCVAWQSFLRAILARESVDGRQQEAGCLEDRLLEFDKVLSQVQCKYLSAGSTISLIQLLVDVRQHSHELVLLAEMIAKLRKDPTDQPSRGKVFALNLR
jgi:hypothetical protein